MTFKQNVGQSSPRIAFVGRGKGLVVLLTQQGIEIPMRRGSSRSVVRIHSDAISAVSWKGDAKLHGETNYFIGNDSTRWHTHVPHFARVFTQNFSPGVGAEVYGTEDGVEYDLRLAPGADASALVLRVEGADDVRLDPLGNLFFRADRQELRMKKPRIFEELPDGSRYEIHGEYSLYDNGLVGFRVGPHRANATLVLDPSLSVAYSSFLGGAGADSAQGIALDLSGKLYVGGTTTSASTFPEAATTDLGSGTGPAFFLAKIDPSQIGASSLIYLDFFGGSGNESGGAVAVDASGNAAIFGTTTSPDYPVTYGSRPTNSLTGNLNDLAVTEVNPVGSSLIFSTLFGGNGAEATQNLGGIAFDGSGNLFIASDTNSTNLLANLPPSLLPFQMNFGGGTSDGFLAEFAPATAPHLTYATYLGINGQVGIGGVAVDSGGNAYIAGFTSNPSATFPTQNGFQTTYGGDPYDAFLVKFHHYGQGSNDLAYGTFIGGSGLDKALAVVVGRALPATAYVTGTTQSTNFPTNGTNAAFQSNKKGIPGSSNAFFAAISEDTTDKTTLLYSTYLGGSQSDSGLGIWFSAVNALYLAGKTTSWDFPWLDNLQPFNGDEDAFVAKMDPTSSGAASLLYATPLGGTAPPGIAAIADAYGIAADSSGQIFLAGKATAADFPLALPSTVPSAGFQKTCASCQQAPPLPDAYVVALQESQSPAASVSFNVPKINFGSEAVGAQNIPPLFAGVVNTGNAPLNVNAGSLVILGPNSPDFSLVSTESCMASPIQTGATCSFEVGFSPSTVGPEQAFLAFEDDAPGSPQLLALVGTGSGPLAVISPLSVTFGYQAQNTISTAQIITLTNSGNQNLIFPSAPQLNGPDAGQFKIIGDACPTGPTQPIVPTASCTIGVAFAPVATGSFQATILFTDNSANLQNAQQTVSLAGTGVAPAPAVSIQPSAIGFGTQPTGVTTAAQSVTLTNSGGVPLTLSGVSIGGADAANYTIVSTANNPCPVAGGIIAINASCMVSVNFSPQSAGLKSASLQFSDNVTGSPQSVALTGTGTASASLSISPQSLDFGAQTVAVTSPPQSVTLKNTGQTLLSINSISVIGADPGDFSAGQCAPVLAANATCLVSVTMNPQASGPRSASLSISDNAPGSPRNVPLAGQAVLPGIAISPTSLVFPSQLAGTASATSLPVTISNPSTGILSINQLSFSGNNATDFTMKSNTCLPTVSPSSSCTIGIGFSPQSGGTQCGSSQLSRCATLTIVDNAPQGSPNAISLSGTATDFAIATPLEGTTSATVSPGQTATYNLTLVSSGYSGTVNLSISAPSAPETRATFPATLTLSTNQTIPFQVTINTTAPSMSSPRLPTPPVTYTILQVNRGIFTAILLLCLFVTFGFKLVRKLGQDQIRERVDAAVLAVLLFFALLTGGVEELATRRSATLAPPWGPTRSC